MKPILVLVRLLILASPAFLRAADVVAPDYSAFTRSHRVPFANRTPVDFNRLQTLLVRVSINGGPAMLMQVDTGSTGVIAGAADVPGLSPGAPAGSIRYSSSGVELKGVWTPATIAFLDAQDAGGQPVTAQVPVLAVHERIVHEGAVNSGSFKSTKNPKVYMFGVGPGRGKEPHQEKNPFLNLKAMLEGTMRRGYAITREGFTLGLTAEDAKGYSFEKLTERTGPPGFKPIDRAPKDWDGPRGWVTVGGVKQRDSYMLLDTGLTNMMIEFPDLDANRDVPEGTEISVHLMGGRLGYSFRTGDVANPVTPRRVTWTKHAGGPIINTGLRALALYDYLYDTDGGWFGLRPALKQP